MTVVTVLLPALLQAKRWKASRRTSQVSACNYCCRIVEDLIDAVRSGIRALHVSATGCQNFRKASVSFVQITQILPLQFFLSIMDRGCEDRIEKQSALFERVHRLAAGGTQVR